VAWDDLNDAPLAPDRWTVATAAKRWREDGDPLAPLVGLDQELPAL
jgi:bifunctional non-homologous end joining protein LigD